MLPLFCPLLLRRLQSQMENLCHFSQSPHFPPFFKKKYHTGLVNVRTPVCRDVVTVSAVQRKPELPSQPGEHRARRACALVLPSSISPSPPRIRVSSLLFRLQPPELACTPLAQKVVRNVGGKSVNIQVFASTVPHTWLLGSTERSD